MPLTHALPLTCPPDRPRNRSLAAAASAGAPHAVPRSDRRLRPLRLCLAVLLAMSLPALAQAQADAPNPRLPQVEIRAGMHLIKAEVADEPGTRMRGLMLRDTLGTNEGMLFVFPDKAVHCFWMRNTLVALSIAFLDDDGGIVNIADMTPRSEESHCPTRPVRYALEMAQGWFSKRGIKSGARLSAPRVFGTAPGR